MVWQVPLSAILVFCCEASNNVLHFFESKGSDVSFAVFQQQMTVRFHSTDTCIELRIPLSEKVIPYASEQSLMIVVNEVVGLSLTYLIVICDKSLDYFLHDGQWLGGMSGYLPHRDGVRRITVEGFLIQVDAHTDDASFQILSHQVGFNQDAA